MVLDIGCGSGSSCRSVANEVTEGRVIGIDPTPGMVRIAREKSTDAPNVAIIEFMDGKAERIPMDDRSVTVAMAVNSFHHWDDVDEGLAEVLRVLKKNGRFFIADEKLENDLTHGEGPISDPTNIEKLLLDAGFVDVAISDHRHDDEEMYLFSSIKK